MNEEFDAEIDMLEDVYIFLSIKRFLPWRVNDHHLLNVLGSGKEDPNFVPPPVIHPICCP